LDLRRETNGFYCAFRHAYPNGKQILDGWSEFYKQLMRLRVHLCVIISNPSNLQKSSCLKSLCLACRYCWLAVLLTVACTDPNPAPATEPGTEPGGKAAPYTVTGTVLDTNGKPMAGVKVRADNDALYGSAEVTTDADGKYTLPKLEIGGWKIYAWKEITYKGKTYHLRLGMPKEPDYDAFSPGKEGAVKNFKWQLSGNIPDRPRSANSASGYFGGTLRFSNMNSDFQSLPAGTVVAVTLTPVAGATLFDGSAPSVVKKTFTIEDGVGLNYWIHDIPQCEYRITAESTHNGTKKAVLLSTNIGTGFGAAIEGFYFKPSLGSMGNYENGLLGPEDTPFYMKAQ
jgi:hypothetical protein